MFSFLKPLAKAMAVGAAVFIALFAAETALLLKSGAMGLNVETSSALEALFRVVRPVLPGLLARIALLYVATGAVLFGGAFGWVEWAMLRRGWFFALGVFFLALFTVHAGVTRPALFDDLSVGSSLFAFFAERAQPWQPVFVGGAAVGVLMALGIVRRWSSLVSHWPWVVSGAAAVLGLFVTVQSHSSTTERQPLLLLIGIDAFRVDRLAANGAVRSIAPNVDALVKDAVLFDRAYTPIAQTEPAWRSLLTALWPSHTGDRYPLTAERRWLSAQTFPQFFSAAGFQTLFRTDCSRFHYEGVSSGFADRQQPPRGAVNFLLEKLRFRGVGVFGAHALGAWWLPEMVDNRALAGIHEPLGYAQRLASDLVEKARQKPTLFAFHATAAHFPGDARYPFYRQFPEEGTPLPARLRMNFSPLPAHRTQAGLTRSQSEGVYDALIAQADAQLGILVEELKRAGMYDEATIVIFSDHGESFYADRPDLQGGTPVHGARLGDEENRILLAVKLPRSNQGQAPHRNSDLVRLIDVGPTLLRLAALPAMTGDVDGEDFVAALKGEPLTPRMLYAETGFTHASPDVFNPNHIADARRSFDIYRIREDGVVELTDEAHEAVMADKDFGTFDGNSWTVEWKDRSGTIHQECHGRCDARLAASPKRMNRAP